MKINDTILNADCLTVLSELQSQLSINKIPYLQKMQDSGANIMVQCPYHGNGQERKPSAGIRKSDGMFHCFSGDTRVITKEYGAVEMYAICNIPVHILNGNGMWESTTFHNYGKQHLMKLTLSCNTKQKIIYATPEHEWLIKGYNKKYQTQNLKIGMCLKKCIPKSAIIKLDPMGIIHGFSYKVISVENTDRFEDVYCCQTSTHSFALEHFILTGNCFACGEVHTLPEVITYCFGQNDMFGRWGMKWLVKNFGAVSVEEREDVEIDLERNNITNKNNILSGSIHSKSDTFVSEEELDSYRYYHQYWTERGITAEWLIELFDLGYDKKTDCITFPVRDIDGNCLFVARRSVKTKWFNYPKDVEKPLYGLYEINEYFDSYSPFHSNSLALDFDFNINSNRPIGVNFPQDLYITESMIDCLRLWQNGKYAVALNGTGSSEQFKQLRTLPCRQLVLATDNDKAGMLAREKIRKNVANKIITEVILPDYRKDIGECTDEEIQNLKEVF